MRATGFSTGALSKGDFKEALGWMSGTTSDAVELSALRDGELSTLADAIDTLDLSRYKHRSIHAPKEFKLLTEREAAARLLPFARQGFFIVVHPDAIQDSEAWLPLGGQLCLENMDARKTTGRTVEELREWFTRLPDASMCLDLGHARQVDPTMCEAVRFLMTFGDRIVQIHMSEVGTSGDHVAMSKGCADAFRSLAEHLTPNAAVIVESQLDRSFAKHELGVARQVTGN